MRKTGEMLDFWKKCPQSNLQSSESQKNDFSEIMVFIWFLSEKSLHASIGSFVH